MDSSNTLYKSTVIIALVAASLLLIPFFGMQFSNEVNWSGFDFIIAWTMLFGSGFIYKLITSRMNNNSKYRIGVGIAVASALFLVWANLAVGLIGNENNPLNLIYYGVLGVGIFGFIIARFQPRGMSYTMFAMAFAIILVGVIVLIAGLGFTLVINGFFAILFVLSGLFFLKAAQEQNPKDESA